MTERSLPRRLTAAAITLGIGASLASDGRNTAVPAPEQAPTGISAPPNDHIQPFPVERIVIENVTIPGSVPTQVHPQIQETVEQAWSVFSNDTNGQIPEDVPEIVMGGTHTFGSEAGNVQDACVDERAADMLRNVVDLARRDTPVGYNPHDLTIALVNPESRDCDAETGTLGSRRVPAAFGSADQRSIVLFDGEEGPNTAVVAHEMDHAVTNYGHDNRLDCDPAQGNIITVTADCQRVGAGNLDTLMGFNIVESDADPRTGFELRRLGALGEDAVQTIESDTSADVTLQAIANPENGTKIVRIPLSGADFAFYLNTMNNALYLELSSDITEEKTSLKAYFVNERSLTDPAFTAQTDSIHLLNQNYLESGMTAEDTGRTTTIRVGSREINITLQEIIPGSTPATGSVNATIAVTN